MKKKKSKPIHPQLKLIRDRLRSQEQRDKKYNTFLHLANKDFGENPNKRDFMFAKIICAYINETPFALKNPFIVDTMIDLMYRGKSYLFNVVEGDLAEAIARAKALRRNVLSTFLFSDRTGKQMDKNNFANMFDTLKKKCGLADIHFHDIRAKSLTDAERQGLNAQLMAGHKNRAMTDRYIKDRQGDRVTPLNRIPI